MSTVGSLVLGRVIEEVLDPFTPTTPLRITYNNRLLLAGVELKPSAVANKPRVDVGGNDLRVFYTLVLVDPDAPSPSNPSLREYLHWMVIDIPGTTGAGFEQATHHFADKSSILPGREGQRMTYGAYKTTNTCQELVVYERPEPRIGIHRMVFVLFQQLGKGTVFAPEVRHNFNCRSFAYQYNLDTVAATYFNCQREAGSGGRRFGPGTS